MTAKNMSEAHLQLRCEFNALAVAVAGCLSDEQRGKLQTFWSGIVSKRKTETVNQLIVALLEQEKLFLWDVGTLAGQLEALGAAEAVQLCREYQGKAERMVPAGCSHSCQSGERSMDNPGEWPVLLPEEVTSDITVAPSSASLMSSRQSTQPAPTSVAVKNLPPLQSPGLSRKLKPEENEDSSSYSMWTRRQRGSQGVAAQTSSAASSSQSLPPYSPGAPKAATEDPVSWRQPQQETGHPPSPKYTLQHPGGALGHTQLLSETVTSLMGLPAPKESNGGAMPMNPGTTQETIHPLTSFPSGGHTLSSIIDDRSKSCRCPTLSMHSLQISDASSCDSRTNTSMETEPAISVSLPNARHPSHDLHVPNGACPSPGFPSIWQEDTLADFGRLSDFTPEEARSLSDLFGACEVSLNVKNFMLSFQELDSAKDKLRRLAEKLKGSRSDVVEAMHGQRTLLRHLGPLLPETQLISDMAHRKRLHFTTYLSCYHPSGLDWKWLAEELKVLPLFITSWGQRMSNPAETLLSDWQRKISEATVGTLFNLMIKMGREDLAAML